MNGYESKKISILALIKPFTNIQKGNQHLISYDYHRTLNSIQRNFSMRFSFIFTYKIDTENTNLVSMTDSITLNNKGDLKITHITHNKSCWTFCVGSFTCTAL